MDAVLDVIWPAILAFPVGYAFGVYHRYRDEPAHREQQEHSGFSTTGKGTWD